MVRRTGLAGGLSHTTSSTARPTSTIPTTVLVRIITLRVIRGSYPAASMVNDGVPPCGWFTETSSLWLERDEHALLDRESSGRFVFTVPGPRCGCTLVAAQLPCTHLARPPESRTSRAHGR